MLNGSMKWRTKPHSKNPQWWVLILRQIDLPLLPSKLVLAQLLLLGHLCPASESGKKWTKKKERKSTFQHLKLRIKYTTTSRIITFKIPTCYITMFFAQISHAVRIIHAVICSFHYVLSHHQNLSNKLQKQLKVHIPPLFWMLLH